MRLGVLLAAALALSMTMVAQGGWVRAPSLPWDDVLDASEPCAPLEVGAGKRAFTPATDGLPWHEPFEDLDGNGYYTAPDPLRVTGFSEEDTVAALYGDPFLDGNLNGKWDGPWMAGYGHEDPFHAADPSPYYYALAVHDDVWARALAVRCGSLTLGLVSLDAVGLFVDEVQRIRADPSLQGYDHIVVASTHTHDSVDTMGLWGPNEVTDGKDPRTMAHLRAQAVRALQDALAGLTEATVRFAATKAPNDYSGSGIAFGYLQTDLRDPIVVDDTVLAAQFLDADGATIATLVNWSPHPETLCGDWGEISSDFPHWLREGLEQGGYAVKGAPQQGLGGTAVYFSGAVGGMMTTLRAQVKDDAGNVLPNCSYAKAQRIGELVAWSVKSALANASLASVPALRVQARLVDVPVDNAFLLALNTLGIFDHQANFGPATSPGLGPLGNVVPLPYIRTEVNVITLGDPSEPAAQILTVPGELLPEVAIGGGLLPLPIDDPAECFAYNPLKQAFSGGAGLERIAAANPGVPPEPVLRDHMTAQFKFLFGLANDELGYVVPANDFTPSTLYAPVEQGVDRCGDNDHYEESVSASSVLAPVLAQNLTMLLDPGYVPPGEPFQLLGLEGSRLWADTSLTGAHEEREDTEARLGVPAGFPAAFGFLDYNMEPVGPDPAALQGREPRGVWFDTDGTPGYSAGDTLLFADQPLVNDNALGWTTRQIT